MVKWEYKIIQLPVIKPVLAEYEDKEERHTGFGEWEKELDELGEDSWEVICFFDWVESYPSVLLKKKIK